MSSNTVEHKIPAKITNLVNVIAREYKVVEVIGSGVVEYYPSIDKDGNHMSYANYTFDEMMAAKVRRERLAVRLLIKGNAVCAANSLKNLTGYECWAISPTHVDVYVPLMEQLRGKKVKLKTSL